jgi:hypothetical protein
MIPHLHAVRGRDYRESSLQSQLEDLIMENQTPRVTFANAAFSGCAIALLVTDCAMQKKSVADGLVDCLVPGQIRQLDEKVVYPTQRQLIRTTREECRARGGEEK